MAPSKNVGGLDRMLRASLGGILLVLGGYFFLTDSFILALMTAILGGGLLLNAAVCFCSINHFLGIDTTQ